MDDREYRDKSYLKSSAHYDQAAKRVKEIKSYYKELGSFVSVSIFLLIINYFTTSYFWAVFPIAAMLISVVSKHIKVFGFPFFGTLSKEWEEKKLEEEIQRLEDKDEVANWLKNRKRSYLDLDEQVEIPEKEFDVQKERYKDLL